MADNRRILTWTLNAANNPSSVNSLAYRHDLDNYAHKIYSIGCHDFGVKASGDIYDFKSGAFYFNADGTETGRRMLSSIKADMEKYTSIQWYIQMIAFGARTLFGWDGSDGDPANVGLFDSVTAQDNFINQLTKLAVIYKAWGITGIEMDVEASMTDSYYDSRTNDDAKYIALLTRVKNEVCIPNGLNLRINAHAMWGENYPHYYRFHNYKLMAEAGDANGNALIDEIQLMTYDFAWSGSAPGASTPLFWFDDVADWCKQNFDLSQNPNAKLTMDRLFFGAAAYGSRWGIFNEDVIKKGTNITFKNLLGWQNGLYRHYLYDGTNYVYQNQDFITQNGFEDVESKNQIMLPHIYDYFKAEFMNIAMFDGGYTGNRNTYNGKAYVTTYSRLQYGEFGGVQVIAKTGIPTGKTSVGTGAATKTITDPAVPDSFDAFTFSNPRYDPAVEYVEDPADPTKTIANYYCKADAAHGTVEFRFNIPTAGTYLLVALVSFPSYDQQRLNGTLNGLAFQIGGTLPEYYPMFFKPNHWFDVGSFSFNAGENVIVMDGAASQKGVPIFGFVVCSTFNADYRGATLDLTTVTAAFTKKNGTNAMIPAEFVLTSEALRSDARPVILFEDRFLQYQNDLSVQQNGLAQTSIGYYLLNGVKTPNGDTYVDDVGDPDDGIGAKCVGTSYTAGYSTGTWTVPLDTSHGGSGDGSAEGSGALMLNYRFNSNVQVEAEVKLNASGRAGVRFGGQAVNDGYDLVVDLADNSIKLINAATGAVMQSQALTTAPAIGSRFKVRVKMFQGLAYCYFGYSNVQVFGGYVSLSKTLGGACGIVASATTNVYLLSIGTLDRWEPMEKIELIVDGVSHIAGEIPRTVGYDEYGLLQYSGTNELNTRTTETLGISLDYEFNLTNIPGFVGAKNVTIRLLDAGIWYASLYVGDAAGCSIIWAGDADSFVNTMNRAVSLHGAKGIGLWTLGQEDPRVFEMVPDVVPPYRK